MGNDPRAAESKISSLMCHYINLAHLIGLFYKGKSMSLTTDISNDQLAVSQAQAALDIATQKLAQDEAKLASIQPNLSALSQLETDLTNALVGIDTALESQVGIVKDSITASIEQIKSILLG